MRLRYASLLAALLWISLAAGPARGDPVPDAHHEISVRLDPAERQLRVEQHFMVDAGAAVAFELAPWLELVEARVDAVRVAVRREGRRLTVAGPAAESRRVALVLRGVIPELPPAEARAESRGAVSAADGSYLPGYSGWMADTGEDRIRYRLSVEVPRPYRAVATGRLLEERLDGEVYRATFWAVTPSEPPSIFAGPYEVRERLEDGLRIRTYLHPELAGLADDYLKASAEYIRHYAEEIGPYPYADFHVVSAPLPVGLGFPNLTYVGRRVLPLPFMRGRSLAHEVVHNWWGNGVAVDHARGNWAEGLTTYMADYALARRRGPEAAREMRLSWLRNFAALPPERDIPVARFTSKRHDAAQVVGYDKVAFVFHMLRHELGEADFGAGLRRFWEDQRFGVAGWADLQRAFQQTSGRDLAWFFDQWVRRAGIPRIELVEARREGAEGDFQVAVTVRQGRPHYRSRLPVVIDTLVGSLRSDVVLERQEQEFRIPAQWKPLAVRIDPDFETFRRLLPGESPPIFRDVTLSDETVLALPTRDPEMARVARRLARRLLQRDPAVYEGDLRNLPAAPVLVIGAAEDIEGLRALSVTVQALDLAGTSTARAWIERRDGGMPRLFVAADAARSLEAVLRPLPHYRNQSYVVFEGAKVTRKGLWPARASPLSYSFGD
jgi:hypothetical protein